MKFESETKLDEAQKVGIGL